MGNPLCHFEFMVGDMDKARKFYGEIFDWEFRIDENMPDYAMISTGSEPGGGMMKKPAQAPHFALSEYFLVDDIEKTMAKVERAGGKVGVPKMEIPGIGWWAMFFDPDGIPVSIFESAEK